MLAAAMAITAYLCSGDGGSTGGEVLLAVAMAMRAYLCGGGGSVGGEVLLGGLHGGGHHEGHLAGLLVLVVCLGHRLMLGGLVPYRHHLLPLHRRFHWRSHFHCRKPIAEIIVLLQCEEHCHQRLVSLLFL